MPTLRIKPEKKEEETKDKNQIAEIDLIYLDSAVVVGIDLYCLGIY